MEPNRRLDARGAACPGPSVMVAKELEKMEPGQVLEVIVDSEGIANDLKGLVQDKGHQVLDVEESDGDVRVLIRVGGAETDEGGTEDTGRAEPVEVTSVMIAQSTGVANPERAYATSLIPEAALAMDLDVVIFGFMDGVTVLVEREVEKIRHPEFPPLIGKAREILESDGVEAYACELSVQARGITSDDLLDGVEVVGASKFLKLITDPGVEVVWL
ncbi:sulfurtransferase TusA family protein [Methanopyrus sp.]